MTRNFNIRVKLAAPETTMEKTDAPSVTIDNLGKYLDRDGIIEAYDNWVDPYIDKMGDSITKEGFKARIKEFNDKLKKVILHADLSKSHIQSLMEYVESVKGSTSDTIAEALADKVSEKITSATSIREVIKALSGMISHAFIKGLSDEALNVFTHLLTQTSVTKDDILAAIDLEDLRQYYGVRTLLDHANVNLRADILGFFHHITDIKGKLSNRDAQDLLHNLQDSSLYREDSGLFKAISKKLGDVGNKSFDALTDKRRPSTRTRHMLDEDFVKRNVEDHDKEDFGGVKLRKKHDYIPGKYDDLTWLKNTIKHEVEDGILSWVDFKKKYKQYENVPLIKSVFNDKVKDFKAGSASVAKVEAFMVEYKNRSGTERSFPLSYTTWSKGRMNHPGVDSDQREFKHREQLVIQLNTPRELVEELNDPALENFLKDFSHVNAEVHPVNARADTIGWARLYVVDNKKGKKWIIEEVQSDLDSIFGGFKHGVDPVEETAIQHGYEGNLSEVLNSHAKSGVHYTQEMITQLARKYHSVFSSFEKWVMQAILESARQSGVSDIYMYTSAMKHMIESESKKNRFYESLPKEFKFSMGELKLDGKNMKLWHRKAYKSVSAQKVLDLSNTLGDIL